MPKCFLQSWLNRTTVFVIGLIFIFGIVQCGDGDGGGGGGGDKVTIFGTVHDGTITSPLPSAQCQFVDPNGVPLATTITDVNGDFSIAVLPAVDGVISCSPQSFPNLTLYTIASTKGYMAEDEIYGEDVTPATTIFSHHIASQLSGNLNTTKENYLADIAGLGDIHIVMSGGTVIGFELQTDSDPADKDVGLVAFSATSLFNILYKNNTNADFLTILEDFIENKTVVAGSLIANGVPSAKADEWSTRVNSGNKDAGRRPRHQFGHSFV